MNKRKSIYFLFIIAVMIYLFNCDQPQDGDMTTTTITDDSLTSTTTIDDSTTTTTTIAVTRTGLVGEWLFNGDASDTSGNENNGTVNGAALTIDRFGTSNKAYLFDGADDYIEIERSIQDDFSICGWINSSQNFGSSSDWFYGAGIVDAEVAGVTDDFGVSLGGGKVLFGLVNYDKTISSDSVNDSNWHFFTAIRIKSSGQIKLYIDGVLISEKDGCSNSSLTAPVKIRFGSLLTNNNFYSGSIDDIRFYDRALADDEIITLYNENGWTAVTSTTTTTTTTSTTIAGTTTTTTTTTTTSTTSTSTTTTTSIPAVQVGDLKISEVGSVYYGNGSSWIEIYNNSNTTINLSNYSIRSWAMNYSTNQYFGTPVNFVLPNVNVESGTYFLIRGKSSIDLVNGPDICYVEINGYMPFWNNSSGFVEILKNSNGTIETVDFVKFGPSETNNPLTDGNWTGGNAVGFSVSSSDDYGKSLARDVNNSDTNSASDWVLRDFATPGGKNDVTSNTDSDFDGIPDCSEVPGSTFAGLPLYDWGARTGQKDIFIHIDYMDSTDPGVTPRKEALDKIKGVFAYHGYSIHFDVGDLYGTGVENYNLDNKSHKVPFYAAATLGYESGKANVYAYKSLYMDIAKRQAFHYLLMGYSQNADGSSGSSGLAELPGNDILITLGNWRLTTETANYQTAQENTNMLINFQAATIMHELGHNLGLKHGGDTDENYQPNYISIMNYMYQLNGLPYLGSSEGDRYYLYRYEKVDAYSAGSLFKKYVEGYWDLHNGPTSDPANFYIDYSSGTGNGLNEASLNESTGFNYTTNGPVDFNGDGNFGIVSFNLNPTENNTLTTQSGYNDWANINLFFQRTFSGDKTGVSKDSKPLYDPLDSDQHEIHKETLTFDIERR